MYIKTTKPYTFVDPKTKEQIFVSPNIDTAVPDWIQNDIVYDKALQDKTLQIAQEPSVQNNTSETVTESPVTKAADSNIQSNGKKEETSSAGTDSKKS